jgi:hypothetical protein
MTNYPTPMGIPAWDVAAPTMLTTLTGGALPTWSVPAYGASPVPIGAGGLALGYPNGGAWLPGTTDSASVNQWSGEASVMLDAPGYAALGLVPARASSSGLGLIMQRLTVAQQAKLPAPYSAAQWCGASVNTFPGAAGQGVYQWGMAFTAGKGLWQSAVLMDAAMTNPGDKTEIDIEFDGGGPLDVLNLTLHWISTAGQAQQTPTIAANVGFDLTTKPVTLGVAWNASTVTWLCQGKQIGQRPTPADFAGHQVFPMANFAMSDGSWFPAPDASTPAVSVMHVTEMSYCPWAPAA